MALRGDPPKREKNFQAPENGFNYANDFISYINLIGSFNIAAAGYPEGHIEAASFSEDIDNLKIKVDSGADLIITQLFFNNDDFKYFHDKALSSGIKIPIIPGIM